MGVFVEEFGFSRGGFDGLEGGKEGRRERERED